MTGTWMRLAATRCHLVAVVLVATGVARGPEAPSDRSVRATSSIRTMSSAPCPFCAPMPGVLTVQKLLSAADFVALALPVPGGPDDRNPTFRIEQVLTGEANSLRADMTVTLARRLVLGPTRRFLLSGDPEAPSELRSRPVDDQLASVLVDVARLPPATNDDDRLQRLRLFVRHLGTTDRVLAASVAEEFATAPYGVVRRLGPELSADVLIDALTREPRTRAHQGLGYLLLALAGGDAARTALETWFADPERREQVGADGLFGAIILMKDEAGLDAVARARPDVTASRGARRFFAVCFGAAVTFHHRDHPGIVPRARLERALQSLLVDAEMVPATVDRLTSLEFWEAWPEVCKARIAGGASSGAIERATRAYLEACPIEDARRVLRSELSPR